MSGEAGPSSLVFALGGLYTDFQKLYQFHSRTAAEDVEYVHYVQEGELRQM